LIKRVSLKVKEYISWIRLWQSLQTQRVQYLKGWNPWVFLISGFDLNTRLATNFLEALLGKASYAGQFSIG
jgi:hypothetical protein